MQKYASGNGISMQIMFECCAIITKFYILSLKKELKKIPNNILLKN